MDGRIIFIDGTGAANANQFFMTPIFHEIGHVLLSSSKHSDDSNNLMSVHTASVGTLLTTGPSSQCQTIHTQAGRF